MLVCKVLQATLFTDTPYVRYGVMYGPVYDGLVANYCKRFLSAGVRIFCPPGEDYFYMRDR